MSKATDGALGHGRPSRRIELPTEHGFEIITYSHKKRVWRVLFGVDVQNREPHLPVRYALDV